MIQIKAQFTGGEHDADAPGAERGERRKLQRNSRARVGVKICGVKKAIFVKRKNDWFAGSPADKYDLVRLNPGFREVHAIILGHDLQEDVPAMVIAVGLGAP